MRSFAIIALVAAAAASAGCGSSSTGCFRVSSACTVTCAALPGQAFTGNVIAPGVWTTTPDPTSTPVTIVNAICQGGSGGPSEAAACFSATSPAERPASISCDCKSWTVVDPDASCVYSWK
jgi:hypothetical protein